VSSTTRKANKGRTRRRSGKEPDWVELPDRELLELRFCDLGLRVEGSQLEARLERLYEELAARDIRFRPHAWLSEEWFSPDGVPGIAIPFYLAHPRLARLERKFMLEVEGGSESWCLKILRHEAGHAIDTAYRLRRKRCYRDVFGRSTKPYPEYYKPKPDSREYVLHLDLWYAQSHPVEDFAETFAVWLKPQSRWKSQYRGWPALKKLECVERLMQEIAGQTAPVRSREHIDPLRELRKTLREHYEEKCERYEVSHPTIYDRQLRRLFAEGKKAGRKRNGGKPASTFLRRVRPELRRVVSEWTGEYQYTVDQALNEMIGRCKELGLQVDRSEREVKRDAVVLLTVQTMNYLHGGHHRLAL